MRQLHPVRVSDITSLVNGGKKVVTDPTAEITGFKPISVAGIGDLAFISTPSPENLSLVLGSKATLIIVPTQAETFLSKSRTSLIFVDNPRLWFLRCVGRYTNEVEPTGIHETAILETRNLGKDISIGPTAYVGKDVRIGDRTFVGSAVQIHGDVSIGTDVRIKSGAIIGTDGFGFERTEDGALERFPHIGGVVIEDQVEIGANTCVDRGTLSSTTIGFGSKIDNLVHIGHNARIGRNCLITAGSVICGSEIGDNCFVGVGARVKQKVRIGKNVVIGMGAVVLKDVPDDTTVIGVPARALAK
ncbi:MAG TPA: UDP-3-O-(3-hydroxymyristoyl)glucosamine N-acyltransferase [Nitrososphaerales archaeon]|nr:UDP-3-O-(3-hydroxymyristoyl)glucosamine N-acyltransferase [Nitrososphaerales archaeon]